MQPSTAITRTELGTTFSEFNLEMSRRGFIGAAVLRPRWSAVQACDVPLVPLEALLQDHPDDRAPGGTYRRDDWEWDKYSFNTEEHGREAAIDDRTVAVYRDLIEAEVIHAARAKDFVLRRYEKNVATAVYDAAVWTNGPPDLTTAVVNEWDDFVNATPSRDVKAAIGLLKLSCGESATDLIMNDNQLRNLTECDTVVERIKYDGNDDPKDVNPNMLAALFTIPNILVANFALKNTKNAGQSGYTLADIWDDEYVMLAKLAKSDDPAEVAIGRTIMWSEESAGPGTDEQIAVKVEEYREENIRGGVMRARTDYQIKIIFPEAGHLLSNIKT